MDAHDSTRCELGSPQPPAHHLPSRSAVPSPSGHPHPPRSPHVQTRVPSPPSLQHTSPVIQDVLPVSGLGLVARPRSWVAGICVCFAGGCVPGARASPAHGGTDPRQRAASRRYTRSMILGATASV